LELLSRGNTFRWRIKKKKSEEFVKKKKGKSGWLYARRRRLRFSFKFYEVKLRFHPSKEF